MIKFGTSGFRGVIGDNFTKENVQKIAYAMAKIFNPNDIVPIGYDNRFMGKDFAQWFVEVFCAYGKKVKFFTKPVPSPLIAFETKSVELGVMFTASHNPYIYNGMKNFQKGGRELTKEQNAQIQHLANKIKHKKIKTIDFQTAINQGLVTLSDDIKPYCNAVLKHFDKKVMRSANASVVFDAMNGSSVECMQFIAKKLGVNLHILNAQIDPTFKFGLPAPYDKNLQQLKAETKKQKAKFGFGLDGDGDRVSFVDSKGKFYDCNYVSAIVFDEMLKNFQSNFVKNCAMTGLIDKIAQSKGQEVYLAEVGFKNTAIQMLKNPNCFIGAESNGVAFQKHLLFKDGIFFAFYVAEVLAKNKLTLEKLIEKIKKKYHYPCEVVEYAYPFNPAQRKVIEQKVFAQKILPEVNLEIENVSYDDGLKITYRDGYWGVIRFSGNENVIRLFAEMPTLDQAEAVIKIYEDLIELHDRQI